MAEPTSQADLIDELAQEFLARYRKGDRPAISEFVDRCPERAEEIRELFPALVLMEKAAPQSSDEVAPPIYEEPQLTRLGDFRIVREAGRGGMGIVYEAEQVSLGRRVALKVLPQHLMAGEKQRKRFEREAKAAARLHHTNIVPVFGVGEQEGLHYYVMQFIHGLGLDEVIVELKRLRQESAAGQATTQPKSPASPVEQGQPAAAPPATPVSAADVAHSLLSGHFERTVLVDGLSDSSSCESDAADFALGPLPSTVDSQPSTTPGDTAVGLFSDTAKHSFALPGQSTTETHGSSRKVYWESVARMGLQTAQALQYAHDQGIIHRDIKPANLLLDTQGTVWVTDFGLAKATNQQDLTHTGDVLGTLRYMAPEQFEGQADARSDVYSLGLALYELLALQPAFDQQDRHQLVKQVTSGTPVRLRSLDPQIPRDLETIVHKSIDRDPSHRYQTAGEIAADLQRYLGDEPIKAKWVSPVTRFSRWCRRNPMGATVVLLLVLLAIGGPIVAANQIRLRQDATDAAADATKQKAEAIRQNRLALANEAEAKEQRRRAEENLRKAREAVDRLFTRAAEDLSGKPHMEQIRRELLEDALEFYQGFMQQQSDNPVIRVETAYAYDRVANIHSLLGHVEKELQNRRQYHHLLEELHRDYPADSKYRELRAHSFLALSRTLRNSGAQDDAIKHGRFALAEWEALAKDFPTNPTYRMEIIRWYVSDGRNPTPPYLGAVGDLEHETYLHRALTLLDQWESDFPDQPPPKSVRFLATKHLADLMIRVGRFREANEYYKAASAVHGTELPALSTGTQATIVRDLEQAEHELRRRIGNLEQACADFPDLEFNSEMLAKSYGYLAKVLVAQDRFAEGEAVQREAQEICSVWLKRFPRDRIHRMKYGWNCYDLGSILFWNGKVHEASAMYRDAFRMLRELADEFPDVGRHQNHYAWVLVTCPAVEFRDPELSLRYARRAVQLSPQSADYWFNLGYAQYRTSDFADAISSIERGREFATGGASIDAALVQAMAYWKIRNREKGVMLYRQAVKDAADAPIVETTSIDYRVQRAEADRMFANSPAGSSDEQPPAAPGNQPPPTEGATPADEINPQ